MSRRTTISVRQISRILGFFGLRPAGVSFAYQMDHGRFARASRRVSVLVAAVSCGVLLGGCIVTNAEEFPEEQQVPPIMLDTPLVPIGSILAFDSRKDPEVRLPITVRDDNLDDTLLVHTQLTVGQMRSRISSEDTDLRIIPSTEAVREQFTVLINGTLIRQGACNKVEVFVSREFVGDCKRDPAAFTFPQNKGDVARATFWIWELSSDPMSSAEAALGVTTTCPLVTRTTSTASPTSASMPMVQ
jgi:hypothetical protein